jgi:ABC-2 type transport system permease protein
LSAARPIFYGASLLTVLFIPVIPMIAAAVVGTLITVIASRFRHSNLINLIITFAFLSGFMILGFQMDSKSGEALGQMSTVLTKQVNRLYPLAGMYRRAVCELDLYSVLVFLIISIMALTIFASIVGLKFKAINTGIAANRTKSNYKIGTLKQGSPFMALYQKELKRFFSSSLYIMNTAFGIVMMTIGAIAILFVSPQKLAQVMEIPQMATMAGALAPLLVSMCVSMTFITACSISLEGRNLWILKTSPIPVKTIFLSKIAVNLTITLPAVLFNGILIAVGLKLPVADIILLILMPVVYAAFTAISGLVINLLLPKLDWASEVSVIKQSAASMVATFGGIGAVALPMALLLGRTDIKPIYTNAASTVIIAFITCFLYRYLNTKGEKLFHSL